MESNFGEALARLKSQLGVTTDREVASALGLGEKAFNARKARGSFPEDKLFALASRRPELKLDPGYVMTGMSKAEELGTRTYAFPSRISALRGDGDLSSLAAKTGIPEADLALMEAGRAMPTAEQFGQLVAAFPDRSPSWIAGGPRPQLDAELTDIEVILVRNYRQCSSEAQGAIRELTARESMRATQVGTEPTTTQAPAKSGKRKIMVRRG